MKTYFCRDNDNPNVWERFSLVQHGRKLLKQYAYFDGQPLGEPSITVYKNARQARWAYNHTKSQLTRAGYWVWFEA